MNGKKVEFHVNKPRIFAQSFISVTWDYNETFIFILIVDTQRGMSRNNGPGLYEFLMEAELQQYYPGIRGINICI